MKVSPGNNAPNAAVSIAPEKLGTQGVYQSLFSLLLDIESRLCKEARNNARLQIRQCNHKSKVKNQKASGVQKLSRYIE
jgi:hypothetical protein